MHSFKSELVTYVDQAMRHWEFEYRKGHHENLQKYDDMLALTKNILPKNVFRVSWTALNILFVWYVGLSQLTMSFFSSLNRNTKISNKP